MAMVWLVGISLLAGILLALLRFKVLILVPTLFSGMAGLVGAGIVLGHGIGAIVVAIIVCGIALQVGYLGGAVAAGLSANPRGRSLRFRTVHE